MVCLAPHSIDRWLLRTHVSDSKAICSGEWHSRYTTESALTQFAFADKPNKEGALTVQIKHGCLVHGTVSE